jgi:hypothetical protein
VVTSTIDGSLYAVVNVNACEGIEPTLLRHARASLGDETKATRLERRTRHWIADVSYREIDI